MKISWFFFLVPAFVGGGVALSANVSPPQGVTTIALPRDVGPTFKPGAGEATAQQYCTICHSSAYVAIQPPMTAAQWAAEVTKMQHAYGAPIPDAAAAVIAGYLAAAYGKP